MEIAGQRRSISQKIDGDKMITGGHGYCWSEELYIS
jgi:hypothetical protein